MSGMRLALVALSVLAFACSSSSSGDDDDFAGVDGGGSPSSVPTPSCTVTLSGGVTGSWACQADLLLLQNQLALVVADDGSHPARFDAVARFPDHLDLPVGTYGAADIQNASSSVTVATGAYEENQWSADAITGMGTFGVTVTAAASKNAAGSFPGTTGSFDITLPGVPGTGATEPVVAHVDFVTGADFPDAGTPSGG